jgi:hypothetical protein
VAQQLVELGRRPHRAHRLREAQRAARLRLGDRPDLRAEPRRLPRRRAQLGPGRGPLHQPCDRRRGVVGGGVGCGLRLHGRAALSGRGGHHHRLRAPVLGHRHVRRRSVVGPGAHLQERRDQRAVPVAHHLTAPARATPCGVPVRPRQRTGMWPAG